MVFYENGLEVISLKFNAVSTDNWNWFSQANLISSPWNDLKTSSTAPFGIIGPIVNDRYFEFSSKPYKGCDTDSGWMVITHNPTCMWDTRSAHPSIQYSKLATKAVLNDFGKYLNYYCRSNYFTFNQIDHLLSALFWKPVTSST